MLKSKILPLVCGLYLLPSIALSCGQAAPINSPGFCASFKQVAVCHCSASLPEIMCQDMKMLYEFMLNTTNTHTLSEACHMQSDTSPQNCIDDWNCYRNGGKDSKGNSCSGTGKRCE